MISTYCDWKAAVLQRSLFVSSFIPLLPFFRPFHFGCVFVCVAFAFCTVKFHTPTPHSFHYKKIISFVTAVFGFVHFLSVLLFVQPNATPTSDSMSTAYFKLYQESCVPFNISVARHATRCTRHTASHDTVMLILTVKRKPLSSDLFKFTCTLDTTHEEVIFLRKACRLIGCSLSNVPSCKRPCFALWWQNTFYDTA